MSICMSHTYIYMYLSLSISLSLYIYIYIRVYIYIYRERERGILIYTYTHRICTSIYRLPRPGHQERPVRHQLRRSDQLALDVFVTTKYY